METLARVKNLKRCITRSSLILIFLKKASGRYKILNQLLRDKCKLFSYLDVLSKFSSILCSFLSLGQFISSKITKLHKTCWSESCISISKSLVIQSNSHKCFVNEKVKTEVLLVFYNQFYLTKPLLRKTESIETNSYVSKAVFIGSTEKQV